MKVLVIQSSLSLCDPMDWIAHQAPLSMGFSRQNTGVGRHFLLQEIFLMWGLNLGLLHYRQILYRLRHRKPQLNLGPRPLFQSPGPSDGWAVPRPVSLWNLPSGRINYAICWNSSHLLLELWQLVQNMQKTISLDFSGQYLHEELGI